MRKTKVFLYAYINHIGAFNLSARTLAENLDKSKFEVYILSLGKGDLEIPNYHGVKIFSCFYPAKISNHLGILWGIYHADVVFVMRGNHYRFVKRTLSVLRRPSFKRQGNKIDTLVEGSMSSAVGGKEHIANSFNFCTKVYSPSDHVGKYNEMNWHIKYDKEVFLPPFIDTKQFTPTKRIRTSVKNVIFIGNDMIRKNINFYLELVSDFPLVQFHIVGKEPSKGFFKNHSKKNGVTNIIYHGLLKPDSLNSLLDSMDLHCLTSKSEGFGKVTIEVAAKGIPSILFDSYGAKEWMVDKVEGLLVETDMKYRTAIDKLVNDNSAYCELVKGVYNLASRFELTKQIVPYEKVLLSLSNGK